MRPGPWRLQNLWLIAAGVLTIGVYCGCAYIGTAVCGNDDPREAVYNRMVDGFEQGHLSLAREVPAGFAQLQDPYDPLQNQPFRAPPYFLYDLSYYGGKLYAYFGLVPALLLFGPYHLLTGGYLSYKAAAVSYCVLGFLVTAWLLLSVRRRYAQDTPEWLMAVVFVTLGLATGLPTLLTRVDIWEIPIAGATATILCVVAALWQAWHQPTRRAGWLTAASLGIGLAVGTRPTAILIAPVLALPLLREWREMRGKRALRMLSGATLPLLLCLGALGLYNLARFGSPFEFGQTYVLAVQQNVPRLRQFGLGYFWDNLRIYFLSYTPWKPTFPFVGASPVVPLGDAHEAPEFCFGIPGNVPIVFLALAAFWAHGRKDGLAFLAAVVLWIAAVQTGLLMIYFDAVSRYEVEILTPLLGLAAVGLLASEARRHGRFAVRGLWVALASVSVAFNLGHAITHADWTRKNASYWFISLNQTQAALDEYNILVLLEPPTADLHNARGVTLGNLGRWSEAVPDFETAIRLRPGYADAECNLGTAFLEEARPAAAIGPLQESMRLRPDDPRPRELLAKAHEMLAAQGSAPGR